MAAQAAHIASGKESPAPRMPIPMMVPRFSPK